MVAQFEKRKDRIIQDIAKIFITAIFVVMSSCVITLTIIATAMAVKWLLRQ